MNSDNQQVFYCEEGEFWVYCSICHELRIERYYKNNLKSQTHANNVRKSEQLIKTFQVISLI